jgi:formate dehydrogenase subunit delta
MNIDRLVQMANDIAANMSAEPDRAEAVAAITAHLKRFWEPRMRAQLVAFARADGGGLSALARAGVLGLAAE